MIVRTPVRLQGSSTDCAAVCLGIVLEHHRIECSIHELRRRCAVSRDGATIAHLQRGAQSFGFPCTAKRKGLKSLEKATFPVILYWDMRHFVVLEGFTRGMAVINDPAAGRRRMPLAQFQRYYTGICLDIAIDAEAAGKLDTRLPLNIFDPTQFGVRSATFWGGVAAASLLFIMDLLFGGISRTFFDYVVEHQMTVWGYVLALAALPLILARTWMSYASHEQSEREKLNLAARVKKHLLESNFALPLDFFSSHFSNDIFSSFSGIEALSRFRVGLSKDMVQQALTVASASIILWIMAPLMAVVSLAPSLTLLAWTNFIWGRLRELDVLAGEENGRYETQLVRQAESFKRFYAGGMQQHLVATCLPLLGR